MGITDMFKVLRVGERLTKAETWKNRQTLINVLSTALGLVVVFFPDLVNVSEEDIISVATGIAVVVGAVNTYLINATSKKVGIPQGVEK